MAYLEQMYIRLLSLAVNHYRGGGGEVEAEGGGEGIFHFYFFPKIENLNQ